MPNATSTSIVAPRHASVVEVAYVCPDCDQQFATWGACQKHLRAARHCGQPEGSHKGLQQRCKTIRMDPRPGAACRGACSSEDSVVIATQSNTKQQEVRRGALPQGQSSRSRSKPADGFNPPTPLPGSAPPSLRTNEPAAPDETNSATRKERAAYNKSQTPETELAASVFVSGVPLSCNEGRLKELFGKYGEVHKVSLKADKHFAFIDFTSKDAAASALKAATIREESSVMKVEARRKSGHGGGAVSGGGCKSRSTTHQGTLLPKLEEERVAVSIPTPLPIQVSAKAPGFLFLCSNLTQKECLDRCLLGLPAPSLGQMMDAIDEATLLFLWNFESRVMHGVFSADGVPAMNIVKGAYAQSKIKAPGPNPGSPQL